MSIINSYEQIGAAWTRAEDFLRSLHCPIKARVQIEKPEEGNVTGGVYLSFAKVKNQWRICLEDVSGVYATPVADAAVPDRIAAVNHFPALRLAVMEAIDRMVHQLNDAAESLNRIVDQIEYAEKL